MLELGGEVGNVSTGVLTNHEHLAKVGFRLRMTFETVLVPTLLLANLTVPPEALKSLGLHRIREVLRRSNCR